MQSARAEFVAHLRNVCADSSDFESAALAFGELVANAMRHAPPGEVAVRLRWRGPSATLSVSDSGGGFAPNPCLPEEGSAGGRGLYIVSAIAGPLDVRAGPAGCSVSVELGFVRLRSLAR